MDSCPILWRNFSRAGYVTAYVEDEPTIGTFNYKKAGFAHAPTDYYLRPFLLAAQEHMEVGQGSALRARRHDRAHAQSLHTTTCPINNSLSAKCDVMAPTSLPTNQSQERGEARMLSHILQVDCCE